MAEGRLFGRIAGVTGGAQGTGRAVAEEMAREGARVAVFLASDDASAITGAEIVVDCGLSAKYAGQED